MSQSIRPGSVKKRHTTRNIARGRRRFDPAVFLETAAKGRVMAAYLNKQIIFAQGAAADAIFYIRKGKVKVSSTRSRPERRLRTFESL